VVSTNSRGKNTDKQARFEGEVGQEAIVSDLGAEAVECGKSAPIEAPRATKDSEFP
jgi:hypothetical protein